MSCWHTTLLVAAGLLIGQGLPAADGPLAPKAGGGNPWTDSHGDLLPPGALARLGTVRLRHSAHVSSVAFSPDGKTLASGEYDHAIRLWDVATGKEIRRFGS